VVALRIAFFVFAVLCIAAISTPSFAADYTIAAEDILVMNVWGEPQLSQIRLVVGPDGNVTVPVVGPVKAEGLTPEQLASKIAEGLILKKWLKSPQVQILLQEIHKPTVSVLGSVNRPGSFEFKDGDTVTHAIASAGSYLDTAGLAKSTITHKDGQVDHVDLYKLYFKGDLTQNIPLRKGDTIYIPEDTLRRIYVMGEVQKPGMYQLKENMTALSAINLAGGPIPERGKLKATVVVRGDPNNPERVKVDISKMISTGDLRQDVALQPGDVVYVPKTSKISIQDVGGILSILGNFRILTQGIRGF
jgi:polysaccharide biosynthesis/export protein